MEYRLESFFDTVIGLNNIDNFTARDISFGFCCFAKAEHFEIANIQKQVSGYLKKLTRRGLLEESVLGTTKQKSKTYRKTYLFHSNFDSAKNDSKLDIQFIKDCESEISRYSFKILEYDMALKKCDEMCKQSNNLKAIIKSTDELLRVRRNSLQKKKELLLELSTFYKMEVPNAHIESSK